VDVFACVTLFFFIVLSSVEAWMPCSQYFNQTTALGPKQQPNKANLQCGTSKKHEGFSPYVNMRYHTIGRWSKKEKRVIDEFLLSISNNTKSPFVGQWWKTVQLYTVQTGANISRNIVIAIQHKDYYSHGKIMSRLIVQGGPASQLQQVIEQRTYSLQDKHHHRL
jgi:hypothetical protein